MDSTGVRAKRQWSVEVKEVAQARCCQTREKISPAANMGSPTAQIGAWEGKAKIQTSVRARSFQVNEL